MKTDKAFMEQEKRRAGIEIDLLLEGLFRLHEADFRHHERRTLAERISRFAAEQGMSSSAMLLPRVIHDDVFASALCKALLRGEGRTLENPYELHALNSIVETTLSSYPAPKIWIAESTSAEEVLVLAILLAEAKLLHRSHIFITGSNEEILRDIKSEMTQASKLKPYVKRLVECGIKSSSENRLVTKKEVSAFLEELQSRISWFHYSLLLGSSFNEFQLISCRENFFSFTAPARRRILNLFHESLSSFGVINVGGNAQEDMALLRSYRLLSDNGIFQRSA